MITAADIMTTSVVTLTPDMDILSATRILLERKINGAPVLEDGRIVGILCQADLVAQQKVLAMPSVFTILDGLIPLKSTERMEEELQKISAITVGQAMTGDVEVIGPDTPVTDIASIMVDRKLHTLPVMADGELVGVVGKEDVLRTLLDKEQ